MKTIHDFNRMAIKAFSFIRSLHVFIFVMVVLIITSSIGIIVPQGKVLDEYILKFGKNISHIIVALHFDHIFSSIWFTIPLSLFCINLLSCLINRIFHLARKRSAYGPFLVHAGLLFLIIGGICQFFGSESHRIILAECTTQNIEKLNLNIELDSFNIVTGTKKEISNYVSYIKIINTNGNVIADSKTMVNSPFTYKNISIYQTKYGTLPNKIKDMQGSVISKSGDTLFSGSIPFKKRINCSKENLSFICDEFQCDFRFDMKSGMAYSRSHEHLNPAFHFILSRKDSIIESHWNLPFSKIMMNRDYASYIINVNSYSPSFYTELLVRKNVGTIWIWIGIVCLSFGMIILFLIPAFSSENKTLQANRSEDNPELERKLVEHDNVPL